MDLSQFDVTVVFPVVFCLGSSGLLAVKVLLLSDFLYIASLLLYCFVVTHTLEVRLVRLCYDFVCLGLS